MAEDTGAFWPRESRAGTMSGYSRHRSGDDVSAQQLYDLGVVRIGVEIIPAGKNHDHILRRQYGDIISSVAFGFEIIHGKILGRHQLPDPPQVPIVVWIFGSRRFLEFGGSGDPIHRHDLLALPDAAFEN